MNEQEMLDKIASYDYGVYQVGSKIVIADPLDDEDGFYLMVDSVAEAWREFEMYVLECE